MNAAGWTVAAIVILYLVVGITVAVHRAYGLVVTFDRHMKRLLDDLGDWP